MRKDASGHWQIWTSSDRLTRARQITRGQADSGWPVWSPNGRLIAFDSSRTDPHPGDSTTINDVFAMNADGTGMKRLTDAKGNSADAAWSPDGSLLAFDSDRGDYPAKQGIYVMRSDGSDVRRITTLPKGMQNDLAPRFSPNGKTLVFTRYRGEGTTRRRRSSACVSTGRISAG